MVKKSGKKKVRTPAQREKRRMKKKLARARKGGALMVRAKGIPRLKGRGDYKQVISDYAPRLGERVGGMFGPLGGFLGKAGGKLLAKLFGNGDYVQGPPVVNNTLYRSGTMGCGLGGTAQQIPMMVGGKLGTLVVHREYLGDVQSNGLGTNIQWFDVNPGLQANSPITNAPGSQGGLFSWICPLARNYRIWKMLGLVVEFQTTSSDIGGVNGYALGKVCMATNYNVGSPDFTTLQELLNEDGSVSCKPSESLMMGLECKRGTDPLDTLYVCGPAIPEGSDVRFCLPARVYVATSGINLAATQNLGELWVTYHLWFEKPTEMGQVGAFLPTPATEPLAANIIYNSPTLLAGRTANAYAASHLAGSTLAINSGDSMGQALAVIVQPDVPAPGYIGIPPTVGLTNVEYVIQVNWQANAVVTITGDISVAILNCALTPVSLVVQAGSGSTNISSTYTVVPTDPTMPCTVQIAITMVTVLVTEYNTAITVSPTYPGALPESQGHQKVISTKLVKLRAQLNSLEKLMAEAELGGRGMEAEERFRRVLARQGVEKPGSLPAITMPNQTLVKEELQYAVGQVGPVCDMRSPLSTEDFDVVSLEGGGIGLSKSDARLALERAAWERRLQRGEGLAWRVNGDSKSPAS